MRVDTADGDNHALYVYRMTDLVNPMSVLRMPKYELPLDLHWVSNTRLIIEKGKQMGALDKPFSTGEIIATDVDGKKQDYLYGYNAARSSSRGGTRGDDNGFGSVAGLPVERDGHFYMDATEWGNDSSSMLYDVNAVRNTRSLIGDISVSGMSFLPGKDGKARFAYGTNNSFEYVVYRRDGNSWTKLDNKFTGGRFVPWAYSADQSKLYASFSEDDGPMKIIVQNEDGSDRRVLAKDDFGSIDDLQWTPIPRQPFAASSSTGIPTPLYLDPQSPYAKLHMALSKAFVGQFVNFINFTDDGGTLLFYTSSDRNPGTYYLIDLKNGNKVKKLFDVAPWIDPTKMAERRPLRFKASDGTELEAILTFPKGASENNLPMVLMPHGGPHGINDSWYFDDEPEFLANRGYLVLQVNFRSSGGRGANFTHAGYRKWGTRVQQDLIDGVKWAIAEHYADPNRICVYGGSFGGYSAMMTVAREPGMFKCAASFAGVYDLAKMKKDSDAHDSKRDRSYFNLALGNDQAELLANSPVSLVDKLNVPLFLIHGEDDQTVPFSQAKDMRKALDNAHKPYEWMTKPNEGHGFYNEKNQAEFLTKLSAFLDKYIGPGTTGAAPQVSQN